MPKPQITTQIKSVEYCPRYIIRAKPLHEAEGVFTVDFLPIDRIPGFSHKVLVRRGTSMKAGSIMAKDWLVDNLRPSAERAGYFLEKALQN